MKHPWMILWKKSTNMIADDRKAGKDIYFEYLFHLSIPMETKMYGKWSRSRKMLNLA